MKHIDLFSGIGGFSLAFDNIFHEQKNEHIFVEYDPFCQAVLRKHWPDAEIHGDIKTFANTGSIEQRGVSSGKREKISKIRKSDKPFLLTGGFPCQPFSQAGRRKGTSDDRYLWPEMFRVIRATKPEWVIAENVRGLVTWSDGMVLEQVCTDLESEGYEVQPFIIPAVAVNAPHRRDRIWIIANRKSENGSRLSERTKATHTESRVTNSNASDTRYQRQTQQQKQTVGNKQYSWNENWLKVATRLCRMDDGLPRRMDRNPRLKALGNAIVPQVAEQIMQTIKLSSIGR